MITTSSFSSSMITTSSFSSAYNYVNVGDLAFHRSNHQRRSQILLYSFKSCTTNASNIPKRPLNIRLNAAGNTEPGGPGPPPPPPPRLPSSSGRPQPFSGWLNWLLFTILPMLLPLITGKWGSLLTMKNKVDTVIQTVEYVSEIVEDVAETVDKVVEEVEEKLPEASKLKEALDFIEDAAEKTVVAADATQELIDKVEDFMDETITDLEGMSNNVVEESEIIEDKK